ncbi:MAG: NAD-dependent epimerase/dehydratase family protein [Bacteroidales bacterium]|nr:NAD-dependent epimerase/dehydratase family protein [Bacteroidales bacterium]
MKRILVVGAGGQIGTELVPYLQHIYGEDNVIAADLKDELVEKLGRSAIAEKLDVLDAKRFDELVVKYKVDAIYNLVALLSAKGEHMPGVAWHLNITALINALNIAQAHKCSIFTPSSIGAFGPNTPHDNTPQDTIMRPNTIYGICKVTGELLGDYHWQRFGVDARSVRFPGIISNGALPGGGTTDYAVEVFYEILKPGHHYTCEVPEDSYMDMMYMPDALRAAVEVMEADPAKLVHRNSFNIAAMSFCPKELFEVIKKRIPDATFDYNVDPVKAAIADSWPNKMDDTCAREEWGWKPEWDIDMMVDDMLKVIGEKQKNAARV